MATKYHSILISLKCHSTFYIMEFFFNILRLIIVENIDISIPILKNNDKKISKIWKIIFFRTSMYHCVFYLIQFSSAMRNETVIKTVKLFQTSNVFSMDSEIYVELFENAGRQSVIKEIAIDIRTMIVNVVN